MAEERPHVMLNCRRRKRHEVEVQMRANAWGALSKPFVLGTSQTVHFSYFPHSDRRAPLQMLESCIESFPSLLQQRLSAEVEGPLFVKKEVNEVAV